jgi:hypothetical protein
MIIGVPKEIKNGEKGVAMTPGVWMPCFLIAIVSWWRKGGEEAASLTMNIRKLAQTLLRGRRRFGMKATWPLRMRPGSAMVDISVDQGGCFETTRPATHEKPTYIEEGIVH